MAGFTARTRHLLPNHATNGVQWLKRGWDGTVCARRRTARAARSGRISEGWYDATMRRHMVEAPVLSLVVCRFCPRGQLEPR